MALDFLFIGFANIDLINGEEYFGGAAGSMSINAIRLGVNSYLAAPLSNDSKGRKYTKKLRQANVNLDLCTFNSSTITTCTINDVFASGSTHILNESGVLDHLHDIHLHKHNLNHFDAIFLCTSNPILVKAITSTVPGRKLIWIPGSQIVTHNFPLDPDTLKLTKIIFGNEEESKIILNSSPFEHHVEYIVITQGKNGGYILTPSEKINFSAPSQNDVIDTTGAGDTFALGFTYYLLKHGKVEHAIDEAKLLTNENLLTKGALL